MSTTIPEAREAKERLLSVGREMQTLKSDSRFVYLLERVNQRVLDAKEAALVAETWDDTLEKRGIVKGLQTLLVEIDTIISRGRNAERSLNK